MIQLLNESKIQNFKFYKVQNILLGLMFISLLTVGCKKDEEKLEEQIQENTVCETVEEEEPFNHQVTFNYEYDITGLNNAFNDNVFTVDIVLYHSDQLNMSWATLKNEFTTADNAFRQVGVQLNLKKAVNVTFPSDWNNKVCMELNSLPDSGQAPGFYDLYNTTQPTVLSSVQDAFIDFIYEEPNKNRTIFVTPMSGMKIVFAQKNNNSTWQLSNPVGTGAFSFPSYLFHNRIANELRGVINMEQSSGVTLAHELGHKLINVSHEGLSVSPAFSGNSIPGLLGYGNSTTIYGGQNGRWHQERLLLSPYLYKKVNGEKVWNPDYSENGAYDDPIYDGFTMPQ